MSKEIEVKKGIVLQNKGIYKGKTFYVQKGLLRTYFIDEKGKEHIFMFAPKGWIVADASVLYGPTELYIDAIEDSIVVVDIDGVHLSKSNHLVLMKRIAILQKRAIMLMSATAIERYKDFLETYPDIVQRVPQKMIASYLGITPEALSKAKRDSIRAEKEKYLNVH